MWLDTDTGLYHTPNRDYSPALGRWIQQDPAGSVDGIDLYIALRNDPVGRLDAAGLESHVFIQPEITLNHGHQPSTPIGEITITPAYSNGGADHIKVDLDFRWHPLTNSGEQEATGFDLRREDSGATAPIRPEGPPKPPPAQRDQTSTIGLGTPCMGETIKRVVYVCPHNQPNAWWWRIDVVIDVGDSHGATTEKVSLTINPAVQSANNNSLPPYPSTKPSTKPSGG